jgi:hypothetical protein
VLAHGQDQQQAERPQERHNSVDFVTDLVPDPGLLSDIGELAGAGSETGLASVAELAGSLLEGIGEVLAGLCP